MKIPNVRVIDFETEAIRNRPVYPPKPVGVAIEDKYWAWGHPSGNNCTFEQGERALKKAWDSKYHLYQNGKFDYDVATVHMRVPEMTVGEQQTRIHDTLFLIFLHDPYAQTYSLKPSAERILGEPPTERDELQEWIVSHIPGANGTNWGEFICLAPGDLVGRYAVGDTGRTRRLFEYLWDKVINEREMGDAYERERRLMPYLLLNERQGIFTDLPKMEHDYPIFMNSVETADEWLRKKLNSPQLNLDADKDVANAFEHADVIAKWTYTKPSKTYPLGQRSVSKKNLLPSCFKPEAQDVAQMFGYRNRMMTCLRMFMEQWLETSRQTDGTIHTSWNQVRQSRGEKNLAGAKTGRMSCTPPLMNISKDFLKKDDEYVDPWTVNPALKELQLADLPLMRVYLLPEHYSVPLPKRKRAWGHRDYSQQELRILAHFEDGPLLANYKANPEFDVHGTVLAGLTEILQHEFERDRVKRFVFQKIYGGGIPAISEALKCDAITANRVVRALMSILPGYSELEGNVRDRGRAGMSVITWGGREYYAEPPSFSKKYNRQMSYEYKLLNYLIQGSAADCTKEAIIRYHEHPKKDAEFLVTVHDEINCAMPAKEKGMIEQQSVLRESMQSVEFDLPMLSEAKVGPNWGTLEKKKGW